MVSGSKHRRESQQDVSHRQRAKDHEAEAERIRRRFESYVTPHIAEQVFRDPNSKMLAGERRSVTVLVADIHGFTAVADTITAVVEQEAKIKRYEIAGRKVIFYIENMLPGESISWQFQVKAAYPVKAKGVSSQVYSYYQPDIRGETLGVNVTVSGD